LARLNSLAIKKELKQIKQRELDRLLMEGYQKTKTEDASLDAEWEEATLATFPR